MAVEAFGEALTSPIWEPLRLGKNEKVADYLNTFNATVDTPEGRQVAVSTTPMRARDENDKLAAVDLTLEQRASAFVAANSSVDLSIGRSAGSAVRLARAGVSVTPVVDSDVAYEQEYGRLWGENVAEDTDQIVQPTTLGAELFWQLRSATSPEQLRLRFSVPDGAQVQLDPVIPGISGRPSGFPRAIRVVKDGEIITRVTAPQVVDADGETVEAWYDVTGEDVIVRFPHRAKDVKYPLLVDPEVTEYWNPDDWNNSGWAFYENRLGGPTPFSPAIDCCGHPGLAVGAFQYGTYNQNAFAHWYWYTDPKAYIAVTEMGELWHLPNGRTLSHSAVYDPAVGYVSYQAYGHAFDRGYVRHDTPNAGDNTAAAFGMTIYNGGGVMSQPAVTSMGAAALRLGDRHPPTISAFDHSYDTNQWTKAAQAGVRLVAHDDGLGLSALGVARTDKGDPNVQTVPNDYWLSLLANLGCFGTRRSTSPCRRDFDTASAGFPDGRLTYNLPTDEGVHTVRGSAHQISGGQYGTATHGDPWQVKIDRTKPDITPSGSLWDVKDRFVGAKSDLVLNVAATDGSPAAASTRRSGVASLRISLDGNEVPEASSAPGCTRPEGSCSISQSLTLTASQLQGMAGKHSVTMRSVDVLGHPTERSFDFYVDPVEPRIAVDGSLAELAGRPMSESSYRLLVEARDNVSVMADELDENDENPEFKAVPAGAGVLSVTVAIDGQEQNSSSISCFEDSACEVARAFEWNASGVSNGEHTVTITVNDKVGNSTTQSFTVDLQRAADLPERRLDSVDLEAVGSVAGDRFGTSVASVGDIDGDGRSDHLIGAPGANSGAGAAYLVFGRDGGGSIDPTSDGRTVRFAGERPGAFCGTSVAYPGDVNGDDIGDLLIGCPGTNVLLPTSSVIRGEVFVVFGSASPISGTTTLSASSLSAGAGFGITGPTGSATLPLTTAGKRPAVFGERLRSIPSQGSHADLNGDERDDVVIGDSSASSGGKAAAGAVTVIYGKVDGAAVDAGAIAGTGKGFTVRGASADALAGYSAVIADDIDGDALDDLLVGAPGDGSRAGAAYVVAGEEAGADVDLASPPSSTKQLTSGTTGDFFGIDVAPGGDTNLDQRADLVVATSSGAYVARRLPLAGGALSADDGYRVRGPAPAPAGLLPSTALPATTVTPAGDMDGDERVDLTIAFGTSADRTGYTIFSPEASRTIDVLPGLAGQRGSRITTTAAGDVPRALSANGYRFDGQVVTDTSQVLSGDAMASPTVSGTPRPSAGRVAWRDERTAVGAGVTPMEQQPDVQEQQPDVQGRTSLRSTCAETSCDNGEYYKIETAARPWLTIRASPDELLIGNVRRSEGSSLSFIRFFGSGRSRFEGKLYVFGRMFGGFNACGWVSAASVSTNAAGQPFNPSINRPARCRGTRRPKIRDFAKLVNCGHCQDGSPEPLRVRAFPGDGSGARTIGFARNIRPGVIGGRGEQPVNVEQLATEADGSGSLGRTVNWRYISRGGDFVQIRDAKRQTTWGWILRKRLPSKSVLCDISRPKEWLDEGKRPANIDTSPDVRDNKTQRAVNNGVRIGRETWPRVCSNRRYGIKP